MTERTFATRHDSYIPTLLTALLLLPFCLAVSATALAQHTGLHHCGMHNTGLHESDMNPAGRGGTVFEGSPSIEAHSGAHLPTSGLIRGRVIFVQTQNDRVDDAVWPLGAIPAWADAYAGRVREYFSDMSNGGMELQLDVHPQVMITRNSEDGYVYWEQDFGDAIREILDTLDCTLDFSTYDLWDSDGKAYRVQAGADGKVDLLIFIFRSIANSTFMPFSGVSDLGFAGYHFLDGSLQRWAYGGTGQFNDASASGISICRSPGHRMVIEQEFAFQVTIHEFGHKLFGEGHPAELFGALGIMANAGNGYAMNSFERHLAGYIHFLEITPQIDTTVVLRDYVTTGDAVLLPLPRLPRGYYGLEYRTRKSEWDTAPMRGLYAFKLYDSWSRNQKVVEVISAEGKFDWALDSTTNAVYPVRPSPLKGYSRFQRIPIKGKNYWADGWWGDPRSAFTLERPEFSIFKNPSPDFLNGSDTVRTDLHIVLLAMDDSTATVHISYRSPAILSVAAPAERGFSLAAPYPNPLRLSDRGVIPLHADAPSEARVRLHDALGREMQTLLAGRIDAGVTLVPIVSEGLSAGMYSIVLETAEGISTQTLLITR